MNIFLILSLVAACSGIPDLSSSYVSKALLFIPGRARYGGEQITDDVSKYFDNALETISNWLLEKKLDPLPTPDVHKEFSKKVGVVTWHGMLNLTAGETRGVSSLKRNDVAVLSYGDQLLKFHVPITFNSLDLSYDFYAEFMALHAHGGVEAKVVDLELHVDVVVDTKTTDIMLQTFQISKCGTITVKFTGANVIDWLLDLLTDIAVGIFHGLVQNALEVDVRKIVQEEIDKINNLPKFI